ncbi:MAG: murein biosynthesis integral membrane protein MurJ [Opitutales bacterium]|nr:murein biosynthesis integral membrane protein MurJ [Opitutales bacterium]
MSKFRSLKNILKVALGTFGSRVLGLLRDTLTLAFLGVNAISSAFFFGFTIPNLFRRLMGEGALSSAFVPIFSQILKSEGREKAFDFLNKIITRALAILCLLVAAGTAASAIFYFAAQNSGERFLLGAAFTSAMMPYMILICLAALICACLNVLGHFALPALTAVWLNAAIISSILIGAAFFESRSLGIAKCMCAGVLIGGALQLFIPVIQLKTCGWKFRPSIKSSPEVAEFNSLFLPALVGASVIQANILVSNMLALSVSDIAVSSIYVSSRLIELPLGIFTFAIITVYFPKLSMAAAESEKKVYGKHFAGAVISLMFICVPASAGLVALAPDLLELLFQWGKFDNADVEICAPILMLGAVGIPFYSLATLSSRGFHSIKDMKTPMKVSAAAFAVNLGSALILMRNFGAMGLVGANVISGIFQAAALNFAFAKKREFENVFGEIGKILICAVLMGAIVKTLSPYAAGVAGSKLAALIKVAVLVPLGVCIYAALLYALDFREFKEVKKLLRRKN